MADSNTFSLEPLYAELSRSGLVRRVVELAYEEDVGARGGRGDVTSAACVGEGTRGIGTIVAREAGVVAGLRVLGTVVEVFGGRLEFVPRAEDGERVERGTALAELRGPMRDVLTTERTALNLVGRLSGVATLTGEYVAAAGGGGGGAKVYDTRKTTPGLRVLEKYAVRCGGGMCHRMGLHDAVLIKDNHLAGVSLDGLAEFVAGAAGRARGLARGAGERELAFVELEVESLEQLRRVLDAGGCGVGIVLLDNMGVDGLREAAAMRDGSGLAIELEASGGVTLGTIGAIAGTGVERISVGAVTHHAVWMDVAMEVRRE